MPAISCELLRLLGHALIIRRRALPTCHRLCRCRTCRTATGRRRQTLPNRERATTVPRLGRRPQAVSGSGQPMEIRMPERQHVLSWLHIGDLHITTAEEENYRALMRIINLVAHLP